MATLGASYALPAEVIDFRDTIRRIVVERVAPRAAEIDEQAAYPWDLRRLFAEHDLLALPFDVEHGGTGTGTLMMNVAIEEVARGCAASALILMLQDLGTLPIRLFGSDEQKRRLLPRCASGEWSPALALSEAGAGSDPAGMTTVARREGRRLGDQRSRSRGSPTPASPTSTSSSRSATPPSGGSPRSSSRPTAPASPSARSSTSSGSGARRPRS